MAKNILVTGSTGKQGGGVIDALANNPNFTLLAQTRNATGSGAQKLTSKGNNIKVVQGDQEDVPGLFANAKKVAGGDIWGCLLYTSPSPRDGLLSRMPSSA